MCYTLKKLDLSLEYFYTAKEVDMCRIKRKTFQRPATDRGLRGGAEDAGLKFVLMLYLNFKRYN